MLAVGTNTREMLQSVSFVSLFVYYVMPRVQKEEEGTEFVQKRSDEHSGERCV